MLKDFKPLKTYFIENRMALLLGLSSLLAVDFLQLFIPRIIKKSIDALTIGQASPGLLVKYALIIVGIAITMAIFRSHGGSVPELKVINNAEIHILLLDGEELVGAKQNRVLNTTILLKKKSETIIPVSCTEHGRWSYVSEEFTDSGTVMSPKIRMLKARSVSASLHESRQYRSDQGAVWDAINEMSEEAGVSSSTGAMKDVFESRLKELDEYLKVFKCVPKQKGMLVLLNGEVVGLDIVSRDAAYKVLHAKLVKSYAMEAILQKKENVAKSKNDKAKAFIKETSSCSGKKYESIGNGWDYRFEGKKVVGSALLYRKKFIHMAFFRVTEGEKAGPMAGYRRRRGFRTD